MLHRIEAKVNTGRDLLRQPQLKWLVANFLCRRLKAGSDDCMVAIPDSPQHIGKILIRQPDAVGKGRDQLANRLSICLVLLEFNPCRFRRQGAQIVNQGPHTLGIRQKIRCHPRSP